MSDQRCSADHPVAILSVHSHSDRSFLDDRELALLSGELRREGISNDLVLVVMAGETDAGEASAALIDELRRYDPILYERVWSPRIIDDLRSALPEKTFVALRGEHEMLDRSAADFFVAGRPRQVVLPLLRWLRGDQEHPPAGVLVRETHGDETVWVEPNHTAPAPEHVYPYVPNLRPLVINPELLPSGRTFSITGNEGCPFQNDARDNELYAGTEIPVHYGRGCAFCTTGNFYEARPNEETAASVLEQIRYVRRQAPELELLVLKDQNPFGYLTEVVERCRDEGVSGFSLLLETRAEWFLRNAQRFARALEVAAAIDVKLAPFLVGIENFSQAELDRFNKGIRAELNIEFLDTLWKWKEDYGDALDLDHAAFGFILFSPWTTMRDLEINLDGIRRTELDRLRGSLLLARARLYPDTALYYLAKRDGLLVESFATPSDDASRRYGYYPSHPWRHAHADVAHFASLATEVTERNDSRDMVGLFQALVDSFAAAGSDWAEVDAEDVWRLYRSSAGGGAGSGEVGLEPAGEEFRQRFARLIQPLPLDGTFAGGWWLADLRVGPGRVSVEVRHGEEPEVRIDLALRGDGRYFRRSRHYEIRARGSDFSPAQTRALGALADAICGNDR